MLACAQRCTQSLRLAEKNTKKAKGVKKNVVKKHIRHEQYKEARNEAIRPELVMNNTPVTEVTFQMTVVGITILLKLQHTLVTLKYIRAFKIKLDRKSLKCMYILYIRPILQYGGTVWDNCSHEHQNYFKLCKLRL